MMDGRVLAEEAQRLTRHAFGALRSVERSTWPENDDGTQVEMKRRSERGKSAAAVKTWLR